MTNEQYGQFLESIRLSGDHSKCAPREPAGTEHTPSAWSDTRFNGPNQPVTGLDWFDAWAYAEWAGKHLPTEAQWEKAARGTDGRRFPWGNEWDVSKYNAGGILGRTANVGSYPDDRSPFGCLDMAGNVREWVRSLDWPAPYDPDDGREDVNRGGERLLRGGGWKQVVPRMRFKAPTVDQYDDWGVRCVKPVADPG